jgi:hypothetical protein
VWEGRGAGGTAFRAFHTLNGDLCPLADAPIVFTSRVGNCGKNTYDYSRLDSTFVLGRLSEATSEWQIKDRMK